MTPVLIELRGARTLLLGALLLRRCFDQLVNGMLYMLFTERMEHAA